MRTKRNSLLQLLVITLFLVAPFVMTYEDMEQAELINIRTLPSFLPNFSSGIRWGALGLLCLVSLFYLGKRKSFIISTPVYFLAGFYFLQFLYALVDGVEYFRFLLLTIFSLLIPPIIGLAIKEDIKIVRYCAYCIILFLVVSIILNGHLVLIGQRFLGFLSNANTYGISTVFWLVIVLIANKYQLLNKKLFIILIIILFLTMIFSGSRNAFVGFFLILSINYYNHFKKVTLGVIILILAFVITSYYIDLSFVNNRYENILNASSDTGRQAIWERAYYAIDQNFWWGNGMDANYRIADTGNMHNSYIRFVLNMGMFFTILTLFMYFSSIVAAYSKQGKVPFVLVGYLLTFALMNIGEDFFVGLGSAVFIYLLFIYGFINYYITKSK